MTSSLENEMEQYSAKLEVNKKKSIGDKQG